MKNMKYTRYREYTHEAPRIYFLRLLVLILVVFSVLAQEAQAVAGVPKILNYQGRLLDASGNLLGGAGTAFCFKFSIYDDATVGGPDTKLWPTATSTGMSIIVKNGIFNAGVGDTSAGGDTLDYNFQDNDAVFLNTDVANKVGASCTDGDESYENLGPRQRILASGYTINSDTVDGFHAAQSATGSQITALTAGNLILGGINPQLNATSTNTLTLQGGTGTGDIQFFSVLNKLTSTGALTIAGGLTAVGINSSSGLLQGAGGLTISSGVSSLQGLTFTNATGTGNLQVATLNTTGAATFSSSTIFSNATNTLLSADTTGKLATTTFSGVGLSFLGNTLTWTNPGYITTSTGLTTANFASTSVEQWANNGLYLTTSTGLGSINFATTSVGQWANNGLYLTTSTGLTAANHSTSAISQWTNNGVYLTTSTGLGIVNFTTSSISQWNTGILPAANGGTATTTALGTNAFNSTAFISTSTGLGSANFTTTSVGQWANNGLYLTTSTGLVVANFASSAISQWANNGLYLTTSTGLGTANFTTTSISQWNNNSGFVTAASSVTWSAAITHTATTTFQSSTVFSNATATLLSADTTGKLTTTTFGGTGLSFSGNTLTWTNPGYITTSTNLGTANFATTSVGQWANNGLYLTTSTGLVVANFASSAISQWANNGLYLTTSTGLGTANFTTTSISQWNNNSGFVTAASSVSWTATSTFNSSTILTGITNTFLATDANGKIIATSTPPGGAVTFRANGGGFVTTSTINFQQGTNVTITTSTDGTYTIASAGAACSTCVSFATGVADNTVTSNNLIQLQKSGVDVFKVANNGGLSIFAATTDIIKTTTGATRTQDFSVTGSTFQNVTSTNDLLNISDGTITLEGTITSSSPAVTTAAAMGLGGQVILRDDGKYIIIHGGASTSISIWDGSATGTMSAAPTALTNAAGAGAIALRRPDGRYKVISGNGSAGLATIYDPYGITASTAGNAVCAGGAATTGTNAILLPGGNYLIMCGGLAATSIYNPTSDVVTVGPPLGTGTFGAGSHALARDDGTFLIFKGNGTSTAIYNPLNSGTGVTTIGTMTDVTITNAPTIAIGAVSIRRQDGQYLVIPGATTTAAIYNPQGTTASPNGTFTSQSGAGNGPSTALGEGAQVIWRQDGNYLLIIGGATVVTTNVVKPGAAAGSQFVTTNAPALSTGGAGVGITAFMKPDGRYAILKGNGTAVDYYDMQFVMGGNSTGTGVQSAYYETECIDSANINANSVINWNANAEGTLVVEERTVTSPAACTTGTYAVAAKSGDLIRLASTTDNRIQFRVTFKRDLPKFFDQEWGIRKTSQTRYRRTNKDPALYDVGVANGLALHRTQFDFGDSNATSGPVSINIANNKDKNLGIALEAGVGYGSTVGTVTGSGGIYNGAFNSNSALTTTAASGTIAMKRPDGKFVVISGNTATANAQLYNPELRTFTALGTTPAAGTGLGALAFKRPDGKFLIVLGNNTNVTSIFDPVANTFTAGPVLTGLAGDGAQVIPLPNGRVLIIHGNYLSTTSIYDPIQNIMIGGPAPSTVVGQGSVVIPRPDGTFLFIPGVVTTNCAVLSVVTNIFNPYTMTFNAINAPTMLGTGPGAFAFQRNDGLWVIVRGGATATTCAALTATTLYNPVENRMAVGPVLSAAAQRGAHAIPRPDGTWLIVHGGTTALNSTSIYREKALGVAGTEVMGQIGVFIAGPTLVTAAGAGSISFQKDNGKIVTIIGNAGTVVNEYDAGWVDKGVYKTEQFNLGTQLGTDSTLAWRANTFTGISAEVMTATTQAGLQTASSREIAKSGGLINPGGSDTWLQINFNFNRKFPSYDRLYTDTWYNSGASFSYAQRKIDTPTLYEYKVTKDKDVIDLQSDGLSIFRVSSAGDVYTQIGGTINTSGADLAERYTSQEELQKGEVVSIDPQNNHGVKKALYQYQPDVLGVVSTDPGFVAGAYTKDSYPIALIGRVPVKVSTENGMIRTGDSLSAASVPGHAMKARLAGRVIGKALESLNVEKLEECPTSEFIIPGRKCGTIMMFVNLIDYGGQSVDLALGEWKAAKETKRAKLAADVGLEISGSEVAQGELPAVSPSVLRTSASKDSGEPVDGVAPQNHNDEVLAFLAELKKEREQGVSSQSEIFTDKLSAVSQVLSPEIVATLVRAQSVEGLEVRSERVVTKSLTTEAISGTGGLSMSLIDGKLVIRGVPAARAAQVGGPSVVTLASTTVATPLDPELVEGLTGQASSQVASTSMMFADVSSTVETASSTSSSSVATSTSSENCASNACLPAGTGQATTTDIVVSFDTYGNAFFAGELIAEKVTIGALDVSGHAKFAAGLEVASLGSASTTINILSDSFFFGRPYFTSDTGGSALIKKGARIVDIAFDREYIEKPIITASIAFTGTSTTDEAEIEKVFTENTSFVVTKKTVQGFSILLNKKAPTDITLNWVAIAIKDSKEFTSRTVEPEPVLSTLPPANVPTQASTTTPIIDNSLGLKHSTSSELTTSTIPNATSTTTVATITDVISVMQTSSATLPELVVPEISQTKSEETNIQLPLTERATIDASPITNETSSNVAPTE